MLRFPSLSKGPVNAYRQKARPLLGLLLLVMPTASGAMADVDLYVLSSFLVVYGGRTSLVLVTSS